MKNTDQKDIILDYVGRVHDAYKGTSESINRTLLLQTLTSPIIIAIALGIVTVNQEFTLAGFTFTIPSWVVLVGGSWFIAGLFSYFVGLFIREDKLTDTIFRLYKSLGYTDKSMTESSEAGAFDQSVSLGATVEHWESFPSPLGKLMYLLNGLLVLGLVIIFPIIVQIVVLYKLLTLFGPLWWILTFSLFLLFIIVSNVILFFRNALS